MGMTKEQLHKFSESTDLEQMLAIFLHSYDQDLTENQVFKLKSLIIATRKALRDWGIDNVYLSPMIIGSEILIEDKVKKHIDKLNVEQNKKE